MKRIDQEIYMLCDEIDEWKEEAIYWKKKYKAIQKQYLQSINDSIKSSKETIGIIFNAIIDPESSINKCHCEENKSVLIK